MTKSEIIAAIADISERMKGPMNNVERSWCHEDRRELRAELAKIEAAELTQAEASS